MNGLRKYSAFFTSSSRRHCLLLVCALNFIYFTCGFCMAVNIVIFGQRSSVLND
eukprot:UN11543